MELVLTSIHARYSKQLDCTTQGGGNVKPGGQCRSRRMCDENEIVPGSSFLTAQPLERAG